MNYKFIWTYYFLDPKDFSSKIFGWSLSRTVNLYKICTGISFKVSMYTYITQRTDVFCIKFLVFKSPSRVGNRPKFSLSDTRHLDPSCRARDETITRRFTWGQVAVELNAVSGETGRAGCKSENIDPECHKTPVQTCAGGLARHQ